MLIDIDSFDLIERLKLRFQSRSIKENIICIEID